MNSEYPMRLRAIRVNQRLGDFFAVTMTARQLREIVFLDPTRIDSVSKKSFWYRISGSQRVASPVRAREIGAYINSVESAFPNSIILAGNYNENGRLIEDEKLRWRIEIDECGEYLIVPSGAKVACVVDGQHRLLGFDHCQNEHRDMNLLCAVYLDLPQVYQAYLFATININQRKVDKSLAYEQFGYNLDDEEAIGWAPDKLAVFLARRLNLNPESPLYSHIKIAPLDADLVFPESAEKVWKVSTACIVEGILSLISAKPKSDRDRLHQSQVDSRDRKVLVEDGSPLRQLYLDCGDDALWGILLDYFKKADLFLWAKARGQSYIKKTVGIQALFDVLRFVAERKQGADLIPALVLTMEKSSNIDFSADFFQASGKGRVRIRNSILLAGSWITLGDLQEAEVPTYAQVVSGA